MLHVLLPARQRANNIGITVDKPERERDNLKLAELAVKHSNLPHRPFNVVV